MNTLVNDIIFYGFYVVLGLLGGAWHYLKKRYVEKVITIGFFMYLKEHRDHTFNATCAIFGAEYGLFLANPDHSISLSILVSAITTGYLADSHLNKAPKEKVNEV